MAGRSSFLHFSSSFPSSTTIAIKQNSKQDGLLREGGKGRKGKGKGKR